MHDENRSWNDENRPSWSEIDKKRNRSGQRREEKPAFEGTKKQQAYARTLALKNANKAFQIKKSPDRLRDEEALAAAKGTSAFDELARDFFTTYGAAGDRQMQILLLDCALAEVAIPVIEALVAADKLEPAEKRVIVSKLNVLALTGKMKIKAAAKNALASLQ